MTSRSVSVGDVDRIYHAARVATISRYLVEDPALEKYSGIVQLYGQSLGEDAAEAVWPLVGWLRRVRFALSATPLDAGHLLEHCTPRPDKLEQFVADSNRVAPDARKLVADCVARAEKLPSHGRRPLASSVLNLLSQTRGEHRAILVKDSRYVPCVGEWLVREGHADVSVIGPQQLRDSTVHERMFVLGPLRWYPTHTVASPKALSIDVVSHSWVPDDVRLTPAFAHASGRRSRLMPTVRTVSGEARVSRLPGLEEFMPEELLGTVDVSALSRREAAREHAAAEKEEACLHLMYGDWAVFLPADEAARTFVIRVNDLSGQPEVSTVPVADVEPGMFLILRTEGATDYLREVADRALGEDASELRAAHAEWKSAFRALVDQWGPTKTSRRLSDEGSPRARPQNARLWSSPLHICTNDKEDFGAIMKLIGLSSKTDEYWQKMLRIREAHQRAGFEIRRMILDDVANADFAELETRGWLDFELAIAGAGVLTAFRVEQIDPNPVLISPHRMAEPFVVEG